MAGDVKRKHITIEALACLSWKQVRSLLPRGRWARVLSNPFAGFDLSGGGPGSPQPRQLRWAVSSVTFVFLSGVLGGMGGGRREGEGEGNDAKEMSAG